MARAAWCGAGLFWLWFGTACAATPEHEVDTSLPAVALERGPCAIEPEEAFSFDLPVWDLAVAQQDWDHLHEDVQAEVEVPASVCIAGQRHAIALELQGSSTRRLPKKSFDLKFSRGQELRQWPYAALPPTAAPALGKLLLKAMAKDQTLVREALAFDMYRALGHHAPHTGFVNLRINGRYWGLYAVVEPVNAAFVSSRGLPTPGRLYKGVRKHGSFADFAPGRDPMHAFELHDVQAQPAAAAERGTDEADELLAAGELEPLPAYADLELFLGLLQTTPLEHAAFEQRIAPVFSLDAYLDRMVWVAFTQNGDAVTQNFYLYVSQSRWTQLPWDSDISLGADWRDAESWLPADVALLLDGGNFFSQRLLQIPALRERYRDRFLALLREGSLARVGFERLEYYQSLVERDLGLDAERWQRTSAPAGTFAGLAAFLSARSAVLRDALQQL